MNEVKNTIQCSVPANSEVTITITFGDGQIGSATFKKPDGHWFSGPVNNLSLGKGSGLSGKSMIMTSTVVQSNTDTEFASITYTLNKDISLEKSYSGKFPEGKKAVTFVTTLEFT
jgi:hypothetical protein